MIEDCLSIKEVSKILGVSIQTLRNWDVMGYLKATRTVGGHRRYLSDDIRQFRVGKGKCEVRSAWEICQLDKTIEATTKQALLDEQVKSCGGFSKEQIALLLKNQKDCEDKVDVDLFYEIAAYFGSPYLFDTQVMIHPTTLVSYKAMRSERCVACETYSVVGMSYKENYFWETEKKEAFRKIAKDIDQHCIENCLNNAATVIVSPSENIPESINEAINSIDSKTDTKEPKVVIYPPEIFNSIKSTIKLNENLRKLSDDFNEEDYEIFCSRLIPENKILVGTKSLNYFSGFMFCPYVIACENKNIVMMRIGSILLHGGTKHYAAITVKDSDD